LFPNYSLNTLIKIMKIIRPVLGILFALIALVSCEKEFLPNVVIDPNQIVVEGYIEAGDKPSVPFVILTKTIPFFKNYNVASDLFVKDAEVYVIPPTGDSVRLTPLCWTDLDSSAKRTAGSLFGIKTDSVGGSFNFCVYLDLSQRLKGQAGKSYRLSIKTKDNRYFYATTSIPLKVPLDSAVFVPPPGTNNNDTMMQLRVYLKDPAGVKNYYRTFNSVGKSGYRARSNSVLNDQIVDGKVAPYFVFNAIEPKYEKQATGGLYFRGDTISIKECGIDKNHFDFWNTLEFNANNQGPFASYTRVKFNVFGDNVIGVWGGYSASYLDTIVPRR
jgi:hypothetical protein